MIRLVTSLWLASVITVVVAQDKPTIAVFPFENKSASAQEPWMVYGLAGLIGEGLAASDAVGSVSMDQIHPAYVDVDIFPQSLFDGKITPSFVKYNLDWKSGYALLGHYDVFGDSIRITFRMCVLNRKAFTPAESVSGPYGSFTDFYRTFNILMEAIYGHLILQADLAIPRSSIEKSHVRSREIVADLEGYKNYMQSWMTLRYYDDAMTAIGSGHYDAAIRYFTLARATDNAHTLNIAKGLSDAYMRRGNAFYDQKKWSEAQESYEKALAADSLDANTYYNLGNAHKEQASWDRALECYRKATEMDTANFEAWINTGYVCNAQGRFGEAVASYQKALLLRDSSAAAHYYIGVAYDNQGDTVKARRAYERAIALDPTLSEAHLNLGIILKRQNNLTGARLRYTSAITFDPNNALAHRNLGILLMRNKKETAQALLHLERTLELDPNQPDADTIRKNIDTLKKRVKKK